MDYHIKNGTTYFSYCIGGRPPQAGTAEVTSTSYAHQGGINYLVCNYVSGDGGIYYCSHLSTF